MVLLAKWTLYSCTSLHYQVKVFFEKPSSRPIWFNSVKSIWWYFHLSSLQTFLCKGGRMIFSQRKRSCYSLIKILQKFPHVSILVIYVCKQIIQELGIKQNRFIIVRDSWFRNSKNIYTSYILCGIWSITWYYWNCYRCSAWLETGATSLFCNCFSTHVWYLS